MKTDQPASDQELFFKVGRNLILFQDIENVLKDLVALGQLSFSAGDVDDGILPNPRVKQSLGVVAKTFCERHLENYYADHPEFTECGWSFRLGFKIGGKEEQLLRERIAKLIGDRNKLAHTLISDFGLSDRKNLRVASRWLDQSFDEHSPLLKSLLGHQRSIREGFEAIVTVLQSEEGTNELLVPDIQNSHVILSLVKIARSLADGEGWVSLGDAARRMPSRDIMETVNRFGKKTLTELVAASRLFELKAEPLESGRTRVRFRVKSLASQGISRVEWL